MTDRDYLAADDVALLRVKVLRLLDGTSATIDDLVDDSYVRFAEQIRHTAIVDVATAEHGGWSALLPRTPECGEAEDLDGALDDLVAALRECAAVWKERLVDVSNHRGNWALVMLTGLSDDEQVKGWLLDDEGSSGPAQVEALPATDCQEAPPEAT